LRAPECAYGCMRVNGVVHVSGSKQKEHQESEQQQKTVETATESVHAGSHHMLASPPNAWYAFGPDSDQLNYPLRIRLG
jgi:hypothetical protein